MFLAYRPFLDPLDVHNHWYLLIIPMALFLSLAYKAVRLPDLRDLPRQTLIMTLQVVFGMIALGLAAYLFVQHLAPLIVPR
jgi:hypothetical protein